MLEVWLIKYLQRPSSRRECKGRGGWAGAARILLMPGDGQVLGSEARRLGERVCRRDTWESRRLQAEELVI